MAIRPSAVVSSFRRVLLVVGISALSGVMLAGLALPIVAGLGLTAREGANTFADLPSELDAGPMAERSVILDSDGHILATYFEENRIYVGLDEIAPVMQDAILAIEDDRFFERGPIDFQGTLRAFVQNVDAGETQGGGSTLTQQYVKLVRLSQAETEEEQQEVQASTGTEGYRRKLEELRMAVGVEKELPKEKILERYLNIGFFGSRAYGIEAAARTYFSKSASELKLAESALLAGLVQRPYAYDPTRNPDAAKSRRDTVLNRMASTGRITEKQAAQARQQGLGLDMTPASDGCVDAWAGYFCDYVVNEVRTMEELGDTPDERQMALERGGLTIRTTLSEKAQNAADDAVSDRVAPTDDAIGSLATVEPGTGYIRALSNSTTYGVEGEGVSNLNYAVDQNMGGGAGIQPGSTFKVFVLAAAINQGISLNTSINSPNSISIPESNFETCDGSIRSSQSWTVGNYSGASAGSYNLRTGTEQSINTFFAQLEQRTGICEPANIAADAGMTRANVDDQGEAEELLQVPSFTLGVNEVSPLSMAEAYATFAARGKHCESTSILEIADNNGETIVDNSEPQCDQVVDESVGDAVNSVLQGVIHNSGATGGQMQLDDGRIAAGKTGTTNDELAVWFAGYTPQLSTAVAVADVEAPQESLTGLEYNGEYISDACGGCLPGPVWKTMMDEVHEGMDQKEFEDVDGSSIEGVSSTVPDVRGMTADEAGNSLEDDGFEASVSGEVESDLDEGLVANTEPEAGADASSGTPINLFLSNGVPPGNEDDEDDNGGEDDEDDEGDDDFTIQPPTVDPTPPDDEDDDEDDDGWS